MDINQSTLTGYQSNKTETTHPDTRSTSDTSRAVHNVSASSGSRSSANTVSQPGLLEGQQIKGRVIDLRYNEVTIQLEPTKQVITARLSGDVPLTIGQEAQFQVKSDSTQGQIVLKYMPDETNNANEATVQRALTVSNLPITKRNQAIVTELMNHRMPIDTQTLQQMIRLAVQNKNASPLTLVLMQKYQIPATRANINQFEAYQNQTHQLLKDIQTIAKDITGLIQEEGKTIIQGSQRNSAVQINDRLLNILIKQTASVGEGLGKLPLSQLFNKEELVQLSGEIQQKSINGTAQNLAMTTTGMNNLINQIKSGAITYGEILDIMNEIYKSQTSAEINTLNQQGSTGSPVLTSSALTSSLPTAPAPTYPVSAALLGTTTALESTLTPEERSSLINYLSEIPNSDSPLELPGIRQSITKITQGTATIQETLTLLRETLPHLRASSAQTLLQSPEYAKLLEEALLQRWIITPDKVAHKVMVTELYHKWSQDLNELTSLISSMKDSRDTDKLQEPMRNMQNNLTFLKDLNEAFTYLQLPVQFQNQQAHADLYVMTRRKAFAEEKDNISVLLHLTMTHLGAMNIYLQLQQKQLQAEFRMEEEEACQIIKENLSSLTNSLEKKGYSVQADVKAEYTEPDFQRDFIEQSNIDSPVKRYTFDIRT